MARITVEVEDDVMPYLHALAVVRCCEVDDLIRTALTHLRITQVEKQRVAHYRHLTATGTPYAEDVYRA